MRIKTKLLTGLTAITAVAVPIVAVVSCGKGDVQDNFIKQGSYQDAGRLLKADKADLVPIYSDARKDFDKDVMNWALKRNKDGKLANVEVLAVSDKIFNNGLVSRPEYSQEVNAKLATIFQTLINDKSLTVEQGGKKKQVFDATYSVKSYNAMVTTSTDTEPGNDKHKNHKTTFGSSEPTGTFTLEFVASRDPEQIKKAAKIITKKLLPLLKKEFKGVTGIHYNIANDYSIAAERVASGKSSMGFLPYDTFDSIIKNGKHVHMFAQASRDHLKWDPKTVAGKEYTTKELVKMANDPTNIYKGNNVEIAEKGSNDATWYRSMFIARKGQKINGVLLKDLFENPTKEKWNKVKGKLRIAHGSTTSGASYLMPQEIMKQHFGKFGFKTYKDMFGL
ncbi:MAG: PhnD/SsuA/transferrin family substrate-binding protein [Mycoplasmatales bacterium]|nr:PhnD/SsuA/transferrin family substrate-binding protein [Mycoplasmatales bacterium]